MSVVNVYADNHDTQKNIIDKAKEVNQKIKKEQALKEAGIASEVGKEEPLPLNDPFVGDGSLGGGSGIKVVAESEEDKRNLSVFNFKLVGIIEGSDESYASIIDENGEVLTLAAFEEIAPGVSLVGINSKEIIFDNKGESSVVINFKNQVIERNN
jgi:type II secretory pathway component PulC